MDAHETICPQCGHGLKEYGERKAKADAAKRASVPQIDMSDLNAVWPAMTPVERRRAMRSRIAGTDRNVYARIAKMLGLSRRPAPPTARRAAARALVLAAVAARGLREQQRHASEANSDLATLSDLGIARELEREERELLKTPVGQADKTVAANASWRAEGLAVLAWALNRFDLPPYDIPVDSAAVQQRIGLADPGTARQLLDSAAIRPPAEIDQFATHATIVTWRLRTFRMYPGPWDLLGHLRRQASFQDSWLERLRIVDGDLAMGARSIANVAMEEIQRCERIAVERQIAAYWLQGDDLVYSKVDPSTLLSAC
jgi:Domain of unknown function (DUF4272)